MTNDRLALRATAADVANLGTVADAMRVNGQGSIGSVTTTAVFRTALEVSAYLAREGALDSIMAAARGR